MTHYEVLGVRRGAEPDEIRRAYLRLARLHHPDLEPDADRREASAREMQRVNEAWGVLGDVRRRQAYDRTLGEQQPPQVVRRAWVPHEPDDPDEVDPRDLLDDTPDVDGSHVPRALQLLPPLLLLVAIAASIVGAVTAIPGLLEIGIVVGVVGVALFILVPFAAMVRGRSGASAADD